MAPDHLPEIFEFHVVVIGDGSDGKYTGRAAFPEMAPWIVQFEARTIGLRLVLTKLTIEADPTAAITSGEDPTASEQGIGSQILGRLRVGALLAAVHLRVRAYSSTPEAFSPRSGDLHETELLADAAALIDRTARQTTPHGRGRPPTGDAQLRKVAEARLRIQDEGTRPINATLAQRLDLSTPETAKDLVNRATRAGWLVKGVEGSGVRAPGPKLLAAWASDGTAPTEDSP